MKNVIQDNLIKAKNNWLFMTSEEQEEARKELFFLIATNFLSQRIRNILKNLDVDNLGKILNTPRIQLLKHMNFGLKSLNEIYDLFDLLGIDYEGYPIGPKTCSHCQRVIRKGV